MYRLKRCTNYIKKINKKTTELIVKKQTCICDRGQLVLFTLSFKTVRYREKKITLHNLYSNLPSGLLTLGLTV